MKAEAVAEGRTLSRWFEHWVDVQPDALALTGDDDVRLTYAELERAANRVANAIDALDPDVAFPTVAVAIGISRARARSARGRVAGRCRRSWRR